MSRSWKRRVEVPLARAVLGLACCALLAILAVACNPRPTLPADLELPKAYVAEASGEVEVEDLRFFGHARANYLIAPTGEVDITRLRFWVNSTDITVSGFLGIGSRKERLRCTTFAIVNPVEARLVPPDRLVVPAGSASVVGISSSQDEVDGFCPGTVRMVSATNNAEFDLVHDPAGNRFAIATTFTGSFDGDSVTIRIRMDGSFVNRPPAALIGVGGPGFPVESIQGACPPIIDGNPPYTPANDPAGLRLNLLSLASDPDGTTARSDITREYWLHSAGGPFTLIGNRQLVGPILFPTGTQNRLVLEASDRHGARSRMVCDFLVLAGPAGGGAGPAGGGT